MACKGGPVKGGPQRGKDDNETVPDDRSSVARGWTRLGCVAFGYLRWTPSVTFVGPPSAWAQEQKDGPRNFDYWQPEWMVRELWGPNRIPKGMAVRQQRHTTYMNSGAPKPYAGAKSTIAPTAESISAGRTLYRKNCASCHGPQGLGGGDPNLAVAPSPALLAYMIKRPISVDEYLLWVISEGGGKFASNMPAFRDKMKREDIWRIIAYMRAGFPPASVELR